MIQKGGAKNSGCAANNAQQAEVDHPKCDAQLYYSVMSNAEANVVMKDDAIAPDVLAGDPICTALLPTANVGTAQMIRWRVEARDTANTAGTDPPYKNTTDNDQYFGDRDPGRYYHVTTADPSLVPEPDLCLTDLSARHEWRVPVLVFLCRAQCRRHLSARTVL